MILKKYLEMNEVYKEISHSLSIYHQISIDFSQNKEMIKNWILLMTPISILFLCHFFVLNGIYQNYANEFVANISPDLLINDLGIKIHPLVYTFQENFSFFLLYITTSTIAFMPFFVVNVLFYYEDYKFHIKEDIKKVVRKSIKTVFWSFGFFILLSLFIGSFLSLFISFVSFVNFVFFVVAILYFFGYLYDHSLLKRKKNKYSNKEYAELKDKKNLIKKELNKLEKDLFKDEKSMLLIIEYIHNNEKYIEEIEDKYNFGLSKDEMNALLSKSVNKTQQELIKESFMNDFQKKHKPILND